MDRKEVLIAIAFLLFALMIFVWGPKHFPFKSDNRTYFSGILAYGDRSQCGLIKILLMDQKSCSLPSSFCSTHNEYLNRRVRIAGVRVDCQRSREIRCAREADYYEPNFAGNECYSNLELVKVLD